MVFQSVLHFKYIVPEDRVIEVCKHIEHHVIVSDDMVYTKLSYLN